MINGVVGASSIPYYIGISAAHLYNEYLFRNWNEDDRESCLKNFIDSKYFGYIILGTLLFDSYLKSIKVKSEINPK